MADCISKNNSFILNRLILLSSYIPNPVVTEEILNDNLHEDFDFYWSKEKPLDSSDIQELTICSEYGILAYFYPAEYQVVNTIGYPPSFMLFYFILHWYFHDHIGYYIEILLIHYIQKDNNKHKELFVSAFLNFQEMYYSFFFPNEKITESSSLTTLLVFKKTNLLRLIRFILPCFQSAFWEKLSPRQRFVFSYNLIALTIEKGTYKYLNAFFDNNAITFTENSVVIDGETIYFIPLNLETNMEVVGIYTINKEKQVRCLTTSNVDNLGNSPIINKIQKLFYSLEHGLIIETVLINNLEDEFHIFWKADYTASAIETKALKLSIEFAVLSYLFPDSFKRSNLELYSSPAVLFHFTLHWLYQPDFGYYVENVLIHYIDKTNYEQRKLFKKRFLEFQEFYQSFCFPNRTITKYEPLTTRLLFKKTNILRLIRVIVPSFKPYFWESLTPRQKYFFSANLMALTLEQGTYDFLNAFLDNRDITFNESNVIIYDETINLNYLNSKAL